MPCILMNLNKNPCGSIWQQSEKEGKMRKTNWKWKNSLIVSNQNPFEQVFLIVYYHPSIPDKSIQNQLHPSGTAYFYGTPCESL